MTLIKVNNITDGILFRRIVIFRNRTSRDSPHVSAKLKRIELPLSYFYVFLMSSKQVLGDFRLETLRVYLSFQDLILHYMKHIRHGKISPS